MEEKSTRVRLNLKQNSKGQVSFDVTAESTSPEESEIMLKEAILRTKKVAVEMDLKFVDEV